MPIADSQILSQSLLISQDNTPSAQTPNNAWVKLAGTTSIVTRLGTRVKMGAADGVDNRILSSRAGDHLIEAKGTVTIAVADSTVRLAISKNGATPTTAAQDLGFVRTTQGTAIPFSLGPFIDDSAGTDWWEVWVFASGATTTVQSLANVVLGRELSG